MLHSDQETRVGAVIEGCPYQTSQANAGESWPESQSSESRQERKTRTE